MALSDEEKKVTIKLVIDDLRRLFDEISRNYTSLKSRALGVLAGEVALVTFLFSGEDIALKYLTDAEKVFFAFGTIALLTSFGLLLWIVSTRQWMVPLDLKESRKLYARYDSELDWLEDIKEDYENCTGYILDVVKKRSAAFNKTLIILSCGIIIMLVLKYLTNSNGG